MSPFALAMICGLAFGLVDVAMMIPGTFPDKKVAMMGAFASRFAIGFLIPFCRLPLPAWAAGALVGLLISVPDAIITKAYAPILASGVAGGALIGWIAGRMLHGG